MKPLAPPLASLAIPSLLYAVACGTGGSSARAVDAGAVNDGGTTDSAARDSGALTDARADGGACGAHDAAHPPSPSLAVSGDPGGAPLGYGDPSLLYPAGATAGYMTYTAVGPSSAFTRFATSTDHGATWSYVGDVNAVSPLTITTNDTTVCGAASCTGVWVHEVSSLIDDATDPDAARRYKVFAHSYFIQGSAGPSANALHYEIGSIDLFTTASLRAGATWVETRLLGWTSSSSQSSTGLSAVVTTDPTLSPLLGACVAMTEPGALAHDGVIELALGCERYVSPTSVPIEIVLIRSSDHGAHWTPVSKLLDANDASALGASGPYGPQLNAADLFVSGGTTYLLATPNGPITNLGSATSGYRGCLSIPLSNLDAGTLVRCSGVPAASEVILGGVGLFHGACTWAEGATAAGVMGLTASQTSAPTFQLFASGASAL